MSERLTQQTELDESPADGDLVHVVDISDTTDNAAGSSRKMTVLNLARRRIENEIPAGLVNGSNVTFTLANAPRNTSALKLYRNGARQAYDTHYTLSTLTITMVSAPNTGNIILADYEY